MTFLGWATLLFILSGPSAEASIGRDLGYTSRSISLGGAVVAAPKDSASAYQNPGATGGHSKPSRLHMHWGLIFLNPSFSPIDDVVIENEVNSDVDPSAAPIRGNVDTEYPNTLGQSLGIWYESQESSHRFAFGLVTFLPLDNLALVDTGESYIPEYVLYRSRHQKPEFDLGGGLTLSDRWSLGAGVHLGTILNAKTTVFLQADTTKVSSMRMTAGLKTRATPYLGTQFKLTPGLTLGAVARLPLKQRARVQVDAAGRVLGDLGALDFNYEALGTLFYDPLTLELGTAWAWDRSNSLYVQVDYQAWSSYEAPQLEILPPSTTSCTGTGCNGGITFSGSSTPRYPLRDILVPRVGFEHAFSDSWEFRAGYAFKPSIYSALPLEAGNPIDPDEHRVSLGLGRSFTRFLEFDTPCRIDLHGSFQILQGDTVQKTSGNESGSGTGDRKVGAPGYETGGHLWGGGVSLAVGL